MKELIHKNISGKKVLTLFLITNIVYAFMLLVTIPKVMSYSHGMKLLDMLPTGYNYEYVNSLFSSLGQIGRDSYLFKQIPVDMIYPFLFGISYSLLLAYFLNKLKKLDGRLIYLCLLPLIAGLFDYLENFGIITLINNYPYFSNLAVTLTNIFTIVKSVITTIYFIVLLFTTAIWGIKSLNRKKIAY